MAVDVSPLLGPERGRRRPRSWAAVYRGLRARTLTVVDPRVPGVVDSGAEVEGRVGEQCRALLGQRPLVGVPPDAEAPDVAVGELDEARAFGPGDDRADLAAGRHLHMRAGWAPAVVEPRAVV